VLEKYAERKVKKAGNRIFNTAKRNKREPWKAVRTGAKRGGVVGMVVTGGQCAGKLAGVTDGPNDCDPLDPDPAY
jgi:hypothetical protein